MFQFDAAAPKRLLAIAALAVGLAGAAPAAAAQYFLASGAMNTSRTAHINGPNGFHIYAYVAPMKFTAYEGTSATGDAFNLVAFCVDIFHGIGLGALNLKYDDSYGLTTNSQYTTNTPFLGGVALTASQKTQVGRLVNYGAAVYGSAPNTTDTVNRLAGLQGAIWQVINPDYTVASPTAGVNSYIAAFSGADYLDHLTGYGPVRTSIRFITETGKYGTRSAHQSFAFGAVPEPATWALMIGGFALMGAALRRARRRAPAVRVAA